VTTLAKKKHNNIKMLQKIREELSSDLEKMTPKQREEFFRGAEEVYEGLSKMAKARASVS
jgi:predicted CopG family antitoxin